MRRSRGYERKLENRERSLFFPSLFWNFEKKKHGGLYFWKQEGKISKSHRRKRVRDDGSTSKIKKKKELPQKKSQKHARDRQNLNVQIKERINNY